MRKRLCIDAGHGLSNLTPGVYDPGATAGGASEAEIALQHALAIKFVFALAGEDVFLTRDEASDVSPVGRRDEQARDAGCTHLISLHLNAASSGGPSGTETVYRADRDFAEAVQAAAVRAFGSRDRGVLHESRTPRQKLALMAFAGKAALLEMGFITNRSDRTLLMSRKARIALAKELLNLWRAIP